MIYITAVRVTYPGTRPEHISEAKWLNAPDGTAETSTTAQMVEFLDGGGAVQVAGPTGPADVQVVRPKQGKPYLRTIADGTTKDNLLELARLT